MKRLFSVVSLLLLIAGTSAWFLYRPARAQNPQQPAACCQAAPAPAIGMVPTDMIDGAKHPELIPDVVAYRLFFVTVAESADATVKQKARERAYLRTSGLREQDVQLSWFSRKWNVVRFRLL